MHRSPINKINVITDKIIDKYKEVIPCHKVKNKEHDDLNKNQNITAVIVNENIAKKFSLISYNKL